MINTFLGAAAELGPGTLALLALAAFAAGWVDAVVGGGGLIHDLIPGVEGSRSLRPAHE